MTLCAVNNKPACPGGGRFVAGNATRLLRSRFGPPGDCDGLELKPNIGGSFQPLSGLPRQLKKNIITRGPVVL